MVTDSIASNDMIKTCFFASETSAIPRSGVCHPTRSFQKRGTKSFTRLDPKLVSGT